MKKVVALMLAVLMLASATVCVSAQNTAAVDGVVPSTQSRYYYRDSYFSVNASEYLPSLSTMSFWLASAGAATGHGENQSCNARALLTEIGFSHFEVNGDYVCTPGTDTMGVGMAYKTVTLNGVTSTVLAIVPRSTNYGAEWAGNFTLGASGEAAGFAAGAKKVEDFAKEYTAKYASCFAGTVKVWIVGYSRGAAVANLAAGHFSEAGKVGSVAVSQENIYAYTFETPCGASLSTVSLAKARSFTNIHNIISTNDLVTKLAPENWGFIRYGVDEKIIPETRTSSNTKLFDTAASYLPEYLSAYTAEGKKTFATEQFKARKLSGDVSTLTKLGSWKKENGTYVWQGVDTETALNLLTKDTDKTLGEFWDDLLNSMTIGVGTRSNYANIVQSPLRLILAEMTGDKYPSGAFDVAMASFVQKVNEQKTSLIMAAVSLNKTYLSAILQNIINEVISEYGLDAALYGDLGAQLTKAIPLAVNAIVTDVTLYGGAELFAFFDNNSILFNPHYPDQCVSWLMAMDVHYNSQADAGKVTNVGVTITQTKTTKKVLLFKTTVTTNHVTIQPVADLPTQNVAWRTSILSGWTTGNTFSTNSSIGRIYIRVTDSEGRVTNWEYYKGSVTKK